jgi:flagellar hook-basal body complex protein FliE
MITNDMQAGKIFLPQFQQQSSQTSEIQPEGDKFVDSLSTLIKDVNNLQKDSGDMTERLIKGEPVDIHDVMISAQKAKTGFQLLLELRNKFVDMYHEVTRMQI